MQPHNPLLRCTVDSLHARSDALAFLALHWLSQLRISIFHPPTTLNTPIRSRSVHHQGGPKLILDQFSLRQQGHPQRPDGPEQDQPLECWHQSQESGTHNISQIYTVSGFPLSHS